jgi:hypothetical protein
LEFIWPILLNSIAYFLQRSRDWNTFIQEQQVPISTPEMARVLSCALLMVSVSSSTYVLKQYIQKATAYSQSSRNYLLYKCMTHLKSTFRWTLKRASHSSRLTLCAECATACQVPSLAKVIIPTLKKKKKKLNTPLWQKSRNT